MPVLIPQNNRIDAQAPASVGRLDVQAPNALAAVAPQSQAVEGALEKTSKAEQSYDQAVRQQELYTKGLKASDIVNGLQTEAKAKLGVLGQQKGYDVDAYKQFDQTFQESYQTALSKVDDPELAAMVRQRFNRAANGVNEQRTIQQTKQFYSYQNDVVAASVKNSQDSAMNVSTILNYKDPSTINPIDQHIQNIIDTREKQGDMNGMEKPYETPVLGPEGKPLLNSDGTPKTQKVRDPIVEAQIRSDVGDAIIPMVKTLNASGKANEAKMVIDKYTQYLNAKDKATLLGDNNDAMLRNKALAGLAGLQGKYGQNLTVDQINATPDLGEDVKFKMREINHTNELQRDYETNQKAEKSVNAMFQEIQDAKAGSRPFVDVNDWKSRSNLWKNNKDMLKPSDIENLEKQVTGVTTTDPHAFNDMMEHVRAGDIQELSARQILDYKAKIEPTLFNQTFGAYFRQSLPDTDARKQTNVRYGSVQLHQSIDGAVDQFGRSMFPKDKNGAYNKTDSQLIFQAQTQLNDLITTSPHMTTDEIAQARDTITQNLIKTKNDNKGVLEKFGDSIREALMSNGLQGGKAPTIPPVEPPPRSQMRTPQPVAPASPIPRSQVPAGNTPAPPAQQAQATTEARASSAGAGAPTTFNGLSEGSDITQWRSAYWADPANKNKSFSGDKKAEVAAVKKYKAQKLGQ